MRGFIYFIVIFAAVVIVIFLAWSRVPDMLANNVSKKLGVNVSVGSMAFGTSKIDIDGIEIGNPRGYSLPKAFSAKEIDIKAPITHYFKDDIIIDEINVDDIYLGIEFNSTTSTDGNWSQILQHLQSKTNEEDQEKSVTINKIVFTNIRTELLFRDDPSSRRFLPTIPRIVLTNISTKGGNASDQLTGSILGQMIKEVFIQQNMGGFLKGIFKSPGNAVDSFLKPFEGLFNILPSEKNNEKLIV